MSDYIGSVVAKSLNLAAVVQPRLPSLFEPPQAAGRPASPHTFAEAAGEPESPEVTVATVALPRPPEPDVNAQSQRDRSADNPRGQLNNAALTPAALQAVQLMANKTFQAPQQTESNVPTGIHPIVSRMPAVEHPMTAQLATQQESAQAAAHNKSRLEMVEPRHPMQVQPVTTQKETEQAAVHSTLQPQPVQRLEPAILQAVRPLLPVTVVAQKREMLRPQRGAKSTAAPQASAEPAPTIQVTIGRIEVRATSPAAPPQRQKAASPAMSLEEYLGGRARRGGA
jgi:hypothetical protein